MLCVQEPARGAAATAVQGGEDQRAEQRGLQHAARGCQQAACRLRAGPAEPWL